MALSVSVFLTVSETFFWENEIIQLNHNFIFTLLLLDLKQYLKKKQKNNIFVKKYYGCHDFAADTILYVRQDSGKCSNAVGLYFTWCGMVRCIHVVILY